MDELIEEENGLGCNCTECELYACDYKYWNYRGEY